MKKYCLGECCFGLYVDNLHSFAQKPGFWEKPGFLILDEDVAQKPVFLGKIWFLNSLLSVP